MALTDEDSTAMDGMLDAVGNEASTAHERYGWYTSTHEALGVLLEEFDELKDAVRANELGQCEREAIQVAAVALRLAARCRLSLNTPDGETASDAFGQRSGAWR